MRARQEKKQKKGNFKFKFNVTCKLQYFEWDNNVFGFIRKISETKMIQVSAAFGA